MVPTKLPDTDLDAVELLDSRQFPLADGESVEDSLPRLEKAVRMKALRYRRSCGGAVFVVRSMPEKRWGAIWRVK